MALQLKLALRNVFRNRRRTAITLAAMAFGTVAIILFGGFVNNLYVGVRENTIHSQVGHIQLYRRGFSAKGAVAPYDYLIADYDEVRRLVAALPHVRDVTPRLGFSGLISTGDVTTSFAGSGVDPERETAISSMARISAGHQLSSADPRGVLLGAGLAEGLNAKPGDELTLLTTTKDGAINALAVTVRGIWVSGEKAFDDRFLKAAIPEVQRLVDAQGAVQSVVVSLDSTENTAVVRAEIEALIRRRGLDLEVRTWEDLALRYHQVRALFSRIFGVMSLIVSVIAVLSIANTMMMTVFERTREVGTMMALGTRRPRVIGTFFLESVLLGVVGGAVGVLLGAALAGLISRHGIPLPPPPGSSQGIVARILVVPEVLRLAFTLSVLSAAASSLYPAWRASRLDVVEALRHV